MENADVLINNVTSAQCNGNMHQPRAQHSIHIWNSNYGKNAGMAVAVAVAVAKGEIEAGAIYVSSFHYKIFNDN